MNMSVADSSVATNEGRGAAAFLLRALFPVAGPTERTATGMSRCAQTTQRFEANAVESPLAQLAERKALKLVVVGSSPTSGGCLGWSRWCPRGVGITAWSLVSPNGKAWRNELVRS